MFIVHHKIVFHRMSTITTKEGDILIIHFLFSQTLIQINIMIALVNTVQDIGVQSFYSVLKIFQYHDIQ